MAFLGYDTFDIKNIDTGEMIATDLTPEEVDAWWKLNENLYFGVRVEKNLILVSAAKGE